RFGSDKPDVRFGLELINLTDIVKDCNFKVFTNAVEKGGVVKAINVKGANDKFTRKDIDALTEFVAIYGAKGLAWIKVTEEGFTGPIAKFFEGQIVEDIKNATDAEPGDLLLFGADDASIVAAFLGALRNKLGKELGLIDESQFAFLWITDWPLLEWDEDEQRYKAAHHPFTRPFDEDIELMETNPEKVRAQAYDIVLNGYELGGGSLRIYERD